MSMDVVAQAHKFVPMLFSSQAFLTTLKIALQDERLYVEFIKHGPLSSCVIFRVESGYDDLVRAFLAKNHLEVPAPSGTPAFFYPGLPVYTRYDLSPFPSDPSAGADLVVALFREVCKVKDEDRLVFHWGEIKQTG
jgi:hypothetical protein